MLQEELRISADFVYVFSDVFVLFVCEDANDCEFKKKKVKNGRSRTIILK